MAVAFDAKGTASQHNATAVTSFTYTLLTIGALNNTVLLVPVCFGANVSAVTAHWDSTGANQLMTQIVTAHATTNDAYAFLFGLVAPTAGNHTLSVSWTTSSDYCVDAVSYTGADQTSAATTFKNTTSTTGTNAGGVGVQLPITITSPTNDMAVAAWGSGPITFASGTTGTTIFFDNTAVSGAAQYIVGSGGGTVSPTMQAQSNGSWVAVGCDIAAVGTVVTARTPYDPWYQQGPVLAQ